MPPYSRTTVGEPEPTTAAVAAAITADPRRTVLAIDTYEVLGLLDTWLRTAFLPAPVRRRPRRDGRSRISGDRAPPGTTWPTTPTPVGRMYYGFSTLLCVPNALSQHGDRALGNQAGPRALEEVTREAGLTRFRRRCPPRSTTSTSPSAI